jgi:hypothetical protein
MAFLARMAIISRRLSPAGRPTFDGTWARPMALPSGRLISPSFPDRSAPCQTLVALPIAIGVVSCQSVWSGAAVVNHLGCLASLPSIASRLLEVLDSVVDKKRRPAQEVVHFVSFATGALYGLRQACILEYDPRENDPQLTIEQIRKVSEFHKQFLAPIILNEIDSSIAWAGAGGYYYNSAIYRLMALAELPLRKRGITKKTLPHLERYRILNALRLERNRLTLLGALGFGPRVGVAIA